MDKNEQTFLTGIFNVKTITSAGGILISLYLGFVLFKVLTNDLTHLNESIVKQAEVQEKTNEVLRELSGALQANNEILRILERRIK